MGVTVPSAFVSTSDLQSPFKGVQSAVVLPSSEPPLCVSADGAVCSSYPGDDLEAWLLLLVDLQARDDLTQQFCHLLWGPLLLLFRTSQSIINVVGNFGEAAKRGHVWILPKLLQYDDRAEFSFCSAAASAEKGLPKPPEEA